MNMNTAGDFQISREGWLAADTDNGIEVWLERVHLDHRGACWIREEFTLG